MKKSLLALAVLGAFAGVAQAQTSVTIYGSIDGGVRRVTNTTSTGQNTLGFSANGTYNSNRLGFKGVEDLGGGMNAHFTLENGFNSGTGGLNNSSSILFERGAFVGLGGTWGSVDLGRQPSVNFKTIGAYDPFNYKYTGIVPVSNQGDLTAFNIGGATYIAAGSAPGSAGDMTRINNDIQYTGTFGPVTMRAEYALGGVTGGVNSGSTKALGATYANGPFTVGAAYTKRNNNVAATGTTFADQKNWTVGGAYATGPFRVAVGYADNKQDTLVAGTQARTKDYWVGGTYDITPALALTAAYYETKGTVDALDGKRKLGIIGATYALSKRTNFYADIDTAKFTGAAVGAGSGATATGVSPAGQDKQTGISVGVNHVF